ncbi:kinase-like domain-containing protein [Hyaloraphidium curvatum]|nr:kinase-like domain-containing protein [Hyaloraphidium curvatum]
MTSPPAEELPDLRTWQQAGWAAGARRRGSRAAGSGPSPSPDAEPRVKNDKDDGRFARGKERRKRFRVLRNLGAGTGGSVRAAIDLDTGKEVALKTVVKQPASGEVQRSPSAGPAAPDPADLRRRFDAIAGVRHPNLLAVYEFFETRDSCYVAMELARGGDLGAYCKARGPLPVDEIREVLRGILRGLAHLHSHGMAHRDVKPQNVLLLRENDPSSAVLADFDGSFVPSPDRTRAMRSLVGTPYFLAPELVSGHDYGPGVDVHSAGCIAFLLACGRTPFEGAGGFSELYSRILSGAWEFPDTPGIPDDLADLIRQMLATDPAARPTAADALVHPFFRPGRDRSRSGVRVSYDEDTGELLVLDRSGGSGRPRVWDGAMEGSGVSRDLGAG